MGDGEGSVSATLPGDAGAARRASAGEALPSALNGRGALPLITLDRVCMEFDGKRALSNISLEIPEGEIVGIIGRSGAGKTVLMHLIRGVDQPPTSGQVIYHVVRCAGCGTVELPSRAGQPCPGCGGTYAPLDVDLWAADDQAQAGGHGPDRDHVPADLCPLRQRPRHRERAPRPRRRRLSR